MNPELKERLEQHAAWHVTEAERLTFITPNEATRYHNGAAADIRAAIVSADDATKNGASLAEAAQKADDALTDPRIGTWSYMEGGEIYSDFREASGALRSAIDQWNGVKSCTTT